jgi:iron(III) transport system substrate-binding protein
MNSLGVKHLVRSAMIVAGLALFVQVAAAQNATPEVTPEAMLSTCDKSTGFNLYAAIGYDAFISKAFTAETGIPVNLVDDSTGNLLAKISAEGDNPQWDATWFDGDVAMQALDDSGFLAHWDAPNAANYNELGMKSLPASHAYYPTGVTAASAILYNTNNVPAAGLPKDWTDLLDPAYKDLIAESNPELSGPSYQFIASMAQILGGIPQAEDFFTKLKDNGLQIYDTSGPARNAVMTGAKEFAIIQDASYYSNILQGAPLGIIYPTSGVGVLPSVVGIAKNGKNQGCAEIFANWLLSVDAQNQIAAGDPAEGDLYYIRVIDGVTLPSDTLKNLQDNMNTVKFVYIDIPTYAKAAADYKAWFRDNVAQASS